MRVFNETQRFTQWWLQLINLSLLGLIIFSCYNWYMLKKGMGNVAADDTIGQVIFIALISFTVCILYIFKLETTIDEHGIFYRFFPFHRNTKQISWNDLKNCHTRKYKPLKEYGGWGYRFGFNNGKALNVKGNQGIQLELSTGKKLLLGTQSPEEAQIIINRYFKKNERI
ncbi:MAG: hypothetical protein ACI9SG_002592 [Maribacter sp.]|jgi:hypothetical protein